MWGSLITLSTVPSFHSVITIFSQSLRSFWATFAWTVTKSFVNRFLTSMAVNFYYKEIKRLVRQHDICRNSYRSYVANKSYYFVKKYFQYILRFYCKMKTVLTFWMTLLFSQVKEHERRQSKSYVSLSRVCCMDLKVRLYVNQDTDLYLGKNCLKFILLWKRSKWTIWNLIVRHRVDEVNSSFVDGWSPFEKKCLTTTTCLV